MKDKALTPKQSRFVQEYLVDLNATQSAIRAGYSPKTAQEQGSRLLSNVMVAQAVAEGKEEKAKDNKLTIQKVLDDIEMIKGLAIEGKEHTTALKAVELMGKHLGAFTDKIQHSGPDGGPVQVNVSFTPKGTR